MRTKLLSAAFAAALLAGGAADARAACGASTTVPGTFATIGSAINSSPVSWVGDYCVQLSGNYTANESIDILAAGKTTNGFRLVISSQPGISPILSVVASGDGIAVHSASVTIQGITIQSVATGPFWGISVSSDNVVISSVVVRENGNNWGNGALTISGKFAAVDNSSFTASTQLGLWVTGSSATISYSTITTSGGSQAGWILGAPGTTLQNDYFGAGPAFGVVIATGSDHTQMTGTVVANNGGAQNTMYVVNSASNSFINDRFFSGNGHGAYFVNSASNVIVASTFTSNSPIAPYPCSYALEFDYGSSSNTVVTSVGTQTGTSASALIILAGSDGNLVSQGIFTTNNTACPEVYLNGNANTIKFSKMDNPGAAGVSIGGNLNTISFSSMTANFVSGSNGYAVNIQGSSNTISGSYMFNGPTRALEYGGFNNNIVGSTVATNNGTYAAADFCGGGYNAFTGGILSNIGGNALSISAAVANCSAPVSFYSVVGSTITGLNGMNIQGSSNSFISDNIVGSNSSGASFNGVGVDSNTVWKCIITGNTGASPAVFLTSVASTTITNSMISNLNINGEGVVVTGPGNTISFSTINATASGASAGAYRISGAAYNTLANSYVYNSGGNAGFFTTGASFNTVSSSTLISNGGDGLYVGAGGVCQQNKIMNSILQSVGGPGAGLYFDTSGSNNLVAQSSMTGTATGGRGLTMASTAVNNTIDLSYIYTANGAADAADLGGGGTGNSILRSQIAANSTIYAIGIFDATTTLSSSTIVNTGTGGAVRLGAPGTANTCAINNSTMNALGGGSGLFLTGVNAANIQSNYISGSTGAIVMQTTGSVIAGSYFLGTGAGANGLWIAGNNAVSLGASTMSASGAGGAAMTLGSLGIGPVNANGPLFFRGDLNLVGTNLTGGNFNHAIGGDFNLPNSANWNPNTSTMTFDGVAVPNRTFQTINAVGGGNFNGLVVAVSSLQINGGLTPITVFTDNFAGSTVTFTAGQTYSIKDLRIRGSGPPNGFVNLRSSTLNSYWLLNNVNASTVTAAAVSDSDATSGQRVDANDFMSFDANVPHPDLGWNFLPFLAVTVPGQAYTPGVGVTGAATNQTAGLAFGATVYAVSASSFVITNAAFQVVLNSSDTYGTPSPTAGMTQTLINGATVFSLVMRAGEPNPHNTLITASQVVAQTAFGSGYDNVGVGPNVYTQMQILLPGEYSDPGAPNGKLAGYPPDVQLKGTPIAAVVTRAVDQFFNLETALPPHNVIIPSVSAASATWPSSFLVTSGGFTTFASTITVYSTGSFVTITSSDTFGGVANGVSSPFFVAVPNFSPPSVSLNLTSATVSSIGGALTGAASDGSAMNKVLVGIFEQGPAKFYSSWQPPGAFVAGTIAYGTATLSAQGQPNTNWTINLPDSKLTSGRTYQVTMVAINASGVSTVVVSSFSFNSGALSFGGTGGQGSVSALAPAISTGCQPVIETIVYTVGPSGMAPGGGIAIRIPDGWTTPTSTSTVTPPPSLGMVGVTRSNGAPNIQVLLNPPAFSSATLGPGWTLLAVAPGPPFAAGNTITFSFNLFPPLGPEGRGPQPFSVMAAGDGSSPMLPISTQPVPVSLLPGTTGFLSFTDYGQTSVGPLQTSATMQLLLTDLCGNPKSTGTVVVSSLSAIVPTLAGPVNDATAVFYPAGGGAPVTTVSIPPGLSLSTSFYFVTSTFGVTSEFIHAAASLPVVGNGLYTAQADKPVQILGSSLTFSAVSIDNGSVIPGNTIATLLPGGTSFVTIRFAASAGGIPWDVTVATDPVSFYPPVFTAAGFTDTSHPQNVNWNGVDPLVYPAQFVAPANYFVRIRAAQGVAQDQSLQVKIPQTPFVYGNLGATGAGAILTAVGQGAGYGNAAQASATGYFQLFGLASGTKYDVTASSSVLLFGASVKLSTTAFQVAAAATGGLVPPPFAFTNPGLIRTHVTSSIVIQIPGPRDLTGRVFAHNASYTTTAAGTLHFPPSSVSSDDGAQDFGQQASTWTVLALPPDTYSLDITIPDLHLSTTVTGVALSALSFVDENVPMPRKATVTGFAVLPSTTPFGSFVSLEAIQLGALAPTVFGGAFVPGDSAVHPTSAPYALYGLDPGSWTITAKTAAFASTSTTILMSTADVGNLTTGQGGLDLPLSAGGVIIATVTIVGDTTRVTQCFGGCPNGYFDLPLQAYNAQTFTNTNVQARFQQSAGITRSTVAIGGLDSGVYTLRAFLNGFTMTVPGGVTVNLSTPAVSVASVSMTANSSRLLAEIDIPPLPGGVCHSSNDFKSLGFLSAPPHAGIQARADVTSYTPAFVTASPPTYNNPVDGAVETFYCSSMTFLSPPGGNGAGAIGVMYGPTGGYATQTVPLANNTTATLTLDVSMSTFSLSGRVSLAASLGLAGSGGAGSFAVGVSSVAGVLLNTPTTGYCLLSSSNPVTVSAFHLELVPIDPRQAAPPSALLMTAPGVPGSCQAPAYAPGGGAISVSPIGYIASVNPDGTYQFPGVPAGNYLLRNNPDLDLNPNDGLELAPLSKTVRITSDTTGVDLQMGIGSKVSGSVFLPSGVTASFPVAIVLEDSHGAPLRSLNLGFNAGNAVNFLFDLVPDGRYAVQVIDLRQPRVFVAPPQPVTVAGFSVSGLTLRFQQAGAIKASVAVRQALNGSATQYLLVSQNNQNLLPPSFAAVATANPWFLGGFTPADGTNCTLAGDCRGIGIDPDGKITFEGLLPGTYDVEFLSQPGQGALQDSGVSLVTTVKSSVRVTGGATTDVGVVQLTGGVGLGGIVTDATTGLPVSNVRMQARPAVSLPGQTSGRSALPIAFTDQQGRYFFSGLDPSVRFYDVFAGVRVGEHQGDINPPYEQKIDPSVDLQSTSTLNFALTKAPYSISGQILTRNNEILQNGVGQGEGVSPGAAIYLQKSGVSPTANPVADIVFQTDPYGNFSIPNLTLGTYKMTITAVGYLTQNLTVTLSTGSTVLGQLQLNWGSTMQGSIRKPDGSAPGEDEIGTIVAATPDMSDFFFGLGQRDPLTRSISGYRMSGFKMNTHYRLLFLSSDGQQVVSPPEASDVVFTSSQEVRNIDVVYKPSKPFVVAKDRRAGASFQLTMQLSQPLRSRTANDDDMTVILTTASAQGTLSAVFLADNRRTINATYTPAVNESSFTLSLRAYTSQVDPDSTDPVNPEFLMISTPSFFIGIDGAHKANVNNMAGGTLVVEGDPARVTLPKGAFGIDASSGITVLMQKFNANVNSGGLQGTLGLNTAAANVRSLPYPASAYPSNMVQAVAALPPAVSPFSGFYDILLPLGVRTALSRPVQMTIAYSTGTDPTSLNLYWYNAAANAYILQQDVTGAPPVIDTVNHTITLNVNHFSTFVLFNTGVEVITGNAFPGAEIEAYNFPNPFDLNDKTVHAIHGGACQPNCTVRGTLIRFSLPAGVSGDGSLSIFNVAGERVRKIDLGTLAGGNFYYQEWDGRNQVGRDVASGVYMGEVKVGTRTKFFKMALIK